MRFAAENVNCASREESIHGHAVTFNSESDLSPEFQCPLAVRR